MVLYEQIDKIINKVLETNGAIASNHILSICREIATAALEEGHTIGYDSGFDEGYNLGYADGAAGEDTK